MPKTSRQPGEAERIVNEYASGLFAFCLVMLANRAEAEDAVQDTLLRYILSAPEFESARSERAWLFTVASNRCRDKQREAKRHPRVSLDELAELGAESEDLGVLGALMALPEKYRVVLTLHYVEGYAVSEVAQMLRLGVNTVKSRLLRGRRLLGAALEEGEEA